MGSSVHQERGIQTKRVMSLKLREITSEYPTNRVNLKLTVRLLSVTWRNMDKPKDPTRLIVSQENACMPIAMWGFERQDEITLSSNLGKIIEINGVDLRKNPEDCSKTHPFGGTMSATLKYGTTHRGTFRILADDEPAFLRWEVRWDGLDAPVLDVGDTLSEKTPKRRCISGCRQTIADAFTHCMWTGEPHEEISTTDASEHTELEPNAEEETTGGFERCGVCGLMGSATNIFCSAAKDLVIHKGCEVFASSILT